MSEEKGSIGIIGKAGPTASALRYYRMEVPLKGMEKLGVAHTFVDEGDGDRNEIVDATLNSDIVLAWRPVGVAGYEFVRNLATLKPQAKDGHVIFPPIVICDSDDAVDYVAPHNYVYSTLGIRNWDGSILKPGDKVTWTDVNGEEHVLWEDGGDTRGQSGTKFDIARNLVTLGLHFDAMRRCHGITVSNQVLADHYREQILLNEQNELRWSYPWLQPDIYVFPNSVVPEDYQWPNLAPHEGVRIIWEGGASHMDSWFPIRHALVKVLKENPEAKFVVFGAHFAWMKNEIPEGQLEIHAWKDYNIYKLTRTCLDADINLCPLTDSLFSRCKSAIRFYEASLGPRPEATLAARVGPYGHEIIGDETGLVYDTVEEFVEKLTALIKNADLRKRLGWAAQKWVLDNRTWEKTVPGLHDFYRETLSRHRQEIFKL